MTTANDLTLMQCQTISTIGVMYYIKVISVKRQLRKSITFWVREPHNQSPSISSRLSKLGTSFGLVTYGVKSNETKV